jgi:RIO kinase 1
MRVPNRLQPLLDQGVIEEVLRPLMSGKEAEIYLVVAGGEECVAKVYKDAQSRSFQHRAQYTEGRRVRSSREQRAMQKGSRYGRAQTEDAWSAAEVDAIYRLRAAGVRVPEPYAFIEGVLVMELIKDSQGAPAPRLVDRHFEPGEATELFHVLLREVVKMLCAGIIHADLSDFNVLLSADGPVIIDFPQVVDPAGNQNARKLLLRDVKNLTDFLSRFAPELRKTRYGLEMWSLYERSELDPQTPLTGRHDAKKEPANVSSLLEDILAIEQEVRERREALGLPPPRPARRPVFVEKPAPKAAPKKAGGGRDSSGRGGSEPKEGQHPDPSRTPKKRRRRRRKRSTGPDSNGSAQGGVQQTASASPASPSPGTDSPAAPPRRRRRRRRRRGSGGSPPASGSSS